MDMDYKLQSSEKESTLAIPKSKAKNKKTSYSAEDTTTQDTRIPSLETTLS